jgi:hypothetical protein
MSAWAIGSRKISHFLAPSTFRDITPCSPLKVKWRFGEIHRLHLQGRRTSPARNQLSTTQWRHMTEWRYGSIILDLGSVWRWVVSFTSWPLYPGKRAPDTHWIGGCVGSRDGLDAVEKRKILRCQELREEHKLRVFKWRKIHNVEH